MQSNCLHTINICLLNHAPQYSIYLFLQHFQEEWLNHLCGQLVTAPDCSLSWYGCELFCLKPHIFLWLHRSFGLELSLEVNSCLELSWRMWDQLCSEIPKSLKSTNCEFELRWFSARKVLRQTVFIQAVESNQKTVDRTVLPTNHAPLCHMSTALKCMQGWWLQQFPGQPVPMHCTLLS